MIRQLLDGLDYPMQRLPANLQPNASALLLPLLPALIIHTGSLLADVRPPITSIARSRTISAPHARAILAALPEERR